MIKLAMFYALQISQTLNSIVKQIVELENKIVSIERVLKYANLPSEASIIIANRRSPPNWPQDGEVSFHNYLAQYKLGLKDINLNFEFCEKIDIVN